MWDKERVLYYYVDTDAGDERQLPRILKRGYHVYLESAFGMKGASQDEHPAFELGLKYLLPNGFVLRDCYPYQDFIGKYGYLHTLGTRHRQSPLCYFGQLRKIPLMKKQHGVKVIAITGFTGAGKTEAAGYLAQKGYTSRDIDTLLRSNVPSKLRRRLIAEFGPEIINERGGTDKMVVFRDAETLARYDRIVSPFVTDYGLREIEKAIRRGEKIIFIDSAFIYKLSLLQVCDAVWYIVRDDEKRIEHMLIRDAERKIAPECTRKAFEQLKTLVPTHRGFLELATHLIDNNGTIDELAEQLEAALADCMPKKPAVRRDRHIHLEGAISTEAVRKIAQLIEDEATDEQKEDFWKWIVYHHPYESDGDKVLRFSDIADVNMAKEVFLHRPIEELKRYIEYHAAIAGKAIEVEDTGFRKFMHRCYGPRAVIFRPGKPPFSPELLKKICAIAIEDVAQSAIKQGIRVLDLRVKVDRLNESLAANNNIDFIKTLIAVAKETEEKVDHAARLNFVIPIRRSPARNMKKDKGFAGKDPGEWIKERWVAPLAELSSEELERIIGVDVVGNELKAGESTQYLRDNIAYLSLFVKELRALRGAKGLVHPDDVIVFAHAGENVVKKWKRGLRIIEDLVNNLEGLRYIVHAAALAHADNDTFLRITDAMRKKHITVLASITSNLQTEAIKKKSQYPAKRLQDAGIEVIATTDDPGASATDLPKEEKLLKQVLKKHRLPEILAVAVFSCVVIVVFNSLKLSSFWAMAFFVPFGNLIAQIVAYIYKGKPLSVGLLIGATLYGIFAGFYTPFMFGIWTTHIPNDTAWGFLARPALDVVISGSIVSTLIGFPLLGVTDRIFSRAFRQGKDKSVRRLVRDSWEEKKPIFKKYLIINAMVWFPILCVLLNQDKVGMLWLKELINPELQPSDVAVFVAAYFFPFWQIIRNAFGIRRADNTPFKILYCYADFEETMTPPYGEQKLKMDDVICAYPPKDFVEATFRVRLQVAREKVLSEPTETSYREFYRVFKGVLEERHCKILAQSWDINVNFIKTIEAIKEMRSADKIKITIVGRGFTQPFKEFFKRKDIAERLEQLGVIVDDKFMTNTLEFDRNGVCTGEILGTFVVDKSEFVPEDALFLGDARDARYKLAHFIDVNKAQSDGERKEYVGSVIDNWAAVQARQAFPAKAEAIDIPEVSIKVQVELAEAVKDNVLVRLPYTKKLPADRLSLLSRELQFNLPSIILRALIRRRKENQQAFDKWVGKKKVREFKVIFHGKEGDLADTLKNTIYLHWRLDRGPPELQITNYKLQTTNKAYQDDLTNTLEVVFDHESIHLIRPELPEPVVQQINANLLNNNPKLLKSALRIIGPSVDNGIKAYDRWLYILTQMDKGEKQEFAEVIPGLESDVFMSLSTEENGRFKFIRPTDDSALEPGIYLDGRKQKGFHKFKGIGEHWKNLKDSIGSSKYIVIPYCNLYLNKHFVVFRREANGDGVIYHGDDEFDERGMSIHNFCVWKYTCFVVYKNGEKRIEELEFIKGSGDKNRGFCPNDCIKRVSDGKYITYNVELAFFGQQILKDGKFREPREEEFHDAAQLREAYQHTIIGLTDEGQIVVGAIGGDRNKGQAVTIEQAAEFIKSKGAKQAILVANGGDVNIHHNKELAVASPAGKKPTYVRTEFSGVLAIAFGGEKQQRDREPDESETDLRRFEA